MRAFARDSYEIDAYKEHVNKIYNLAMSEGKASGVFFGSVSLMLRTGIFFSMTHMPRLDFLET